MRGISTIEVLAQSVAKTAKSNNRKAFTPSGYITPCELSVRTLRRVRMAFLLNRARINSVAKSAGSLKGNARQMELDD